MLIHAFIFLLLAGVTKGFLDYYADSGIKEKEWKNKYKISEKGDLIKTDDVKHWWYLGLYKPRFAERFPFSTTILVAFTDKWHLAQLIMLRFFYLAVSVGVSTNIWWALLLSFIIFPMVIGVFFDFTYCKLKKK